MRAHKQFAKQILQPHQDLTRGDCLISSTVLATSATVV